MFLKNFPYFRLYINLGLIYSTDSFLRKLINFLELNIWLILSEPECSASVHKAVRVQARLLATIGPAKNWALHQFTPSSPHAHLNTLMCCPNELYSQGQKNINNFLFFLYFTYFIYFFNSCPIWALSEYTFSYRILHELTYLQFIQFFSL